MQCNKCMHTIDRKRERYTVCEGKCAKRYHAKCVGLSEATVCALFSKNILWMCDECLMDFCNSRDGNVDSQEADTCCTHQSTCEAEIEELKIKVNDIMEALGTMVFETTQQQLDRQKQQHSTPVSSPVHSSHLLHGTRDTSACATMSDDSSPMSDSGETFSLFVTNIDRNATDLDVKNLACKCLNAVDRSQVRVRRLVSKQNENELDYVSFKIDFDKNWKALALKPSTWPKNVRFRAFENRCTVWKPNITCD